MKALVSRWGDFVARRPRRAIWIVFALVFAAALYETLSWPLHDFPGAFWHSADRGLDITIGQANAARAGWREILGFWHGPMLHGHGYFRPLTSMLFVLQYRLFGENDRLWTLFSIPFHLGVVALLFVTTLRFSPGPLPRQLAAAAIGTILLAAPGFADRSVQNWVICWWPAQHESLSLIFGLGMLCATDAHCRAPNRANALAAVGLFFLAICVKEMGYLPAMVSCLLLLRARRWPLLLTIAACGLAFFAYRHAVLGPLAYQTNGFRRAALWQRPLAEWDHLIQQLLRARNHLLFSAVATAVALALRRRGRADRILAAAASYLLPAALIEGAPWESMFITGLLATLGLAVLAALTAGLILAIRRARVLECVLFYTLSVAATIGFPPNFAWYRYWWTVSGAMLAAIAFTELGQRLWVGGLNTRQGVRVSR